MRPSGLRVPLWTSVTDAALAGQQMECNTVVAVEARTATLMSRRVRTDSAALRSSRGQNVVNGVWALPPQATGGAVHTLNVHRFHNVI